MKCEHYMSKTRGKNKEIYIRCRRWVRFKTEAERHEYICKHCQNDLAGCTVWQEWEGFKPKPKQELEPVKRVGFIDWIVGVR